MKTIPLIVALLLLVAPFAAGGTFFADAAETEIKIGASREAVLESLGEPKGYIGSSSFEIYFFDRGDVVFRQGRVESHSLISAGEWEHTLQLAEREAEARAEREKLATEVRLAEGRALRERALSDPQFADLPARERLAFWEAFRLKYPEVDSTFEYQLASRQAEVARQELAAIHAEARRLAEAQRRSEADQLRLLELEMRLEEAERQARLAEDRERSRANYYSDYYYPSRSPVVVIAEHSGRRNDDRRRPRTEEPVVEERVPPPSPSVPRPGDPGAFETRQQALDEQWARRESQRGPQAQRQQYGEAAVRAVEARWNTTRQ